MTGSTVRGDSWRSWLPYGIAIVLIPLAFYAQMVFLGWEPPAPDTQAFSPFGAWGKATEQEIGHTPNWYPYIFSGMPSYGSFLYTPRSAVNPLTWILAPFASQRGARYFIFAVIAAAAVCALVRRQGASRLASSTVGLLYALTPYSFGNVAAGHATKLEALALAPVFLLAFDLLFSKPNLLSAAALGGAGALLLWAHHPQIAFYAFVLALLFGLGRLIAEPALRRSGLPARAFALALASLLVALLVTEPYLAVFEYAPFSIRGGGGDLSGLAESASQGAGWDYATTWSFHPQELISFLFPAWFGLEGRTYWGQMPFTQSTHYFGLVALIFAVVGFFSLRGSRRWIWTGLSLFVLFVGFGRHLPLIYGPMFHFAPMFDRFRVPSMIYGLLPLVLAPLVAAGIDALGNSRSAPAAAAAPGARRAQTRERSDSLGVGAMLLRWAPRLAIAGGVSLLLAFGLMAAMRDGVLAGGGLTREAERSRASAQALFELQNARWGLLQRSILFGLGWLTLTAAWLVFARRAGFVGTRLALGLAVLVLLDALSVARQFYHPEPRPSIESTMPVVGAVRYLEAQTPPFRILPLGDLFGSNAFSRSNLESVGGYHPAKLRAYQDLLDDGVITSPAILSALDVRYVVSTTPINAPQLVHEGDGFVYELPPTPGRAWAVERATQLPDGRAIIGRMRRGDFDPALEALFLPADAPATAAYPPARVTVVSRSPDRLELSVDATGPALVVVSEISYPPAWRARVDGAPVPLRRADHVLMAFETPAGQHRVELTTQSEGQARGAFLARLGAGLTLALAAVGIWRDRSGARESRV